jgi:hypothetical protein
VPNNFKLMIWHLNFLFWKFGHIRTKYNKIIRYFTSFILSFCLNWSQFMLLCWTRHEFKFGYLDYILIEFLKKLTYNIFFNSKIWNIYNLCQNCPCIVVVDIIKVSNFIQLNKFTHQKFLMIFFFLMFPIILIILMGPIKWKCDVFDSATLGYFCLRT